MNSHIQKVYVPMTETGFYILLCLLEESHGYGIVQKVDTLTHGQIRLSPGTLYITGNIPQLTSTALLAVSLRFGMCVPTKFSLRLAAWLH